MREIFDRRVIPVSVLDFVRVCQSHIDCHLGGGAALSGAYLSHRLTGDIDLFSHQREAMRELAGLLPEAAATAGASVVILRDAGHLVRARFEAGDLVTEVDLVYEPIADIESPPPPHRGSDRRIAGGLAGQQADLHSLEVGAA